MAEYVVQDTSLERVADSIRQRTGDHLPLEWPSGYESAIQSISGAIVTGKRYLMTLDADNSSQTQIVVNDGGNADIAAHRSDTSFIVGMMALTGVSNGSTRAILVGNNVLHSTSSDIVYGVYLRSGSTGVTGQYVQQPAASSPVSVPGTMSVDSNGVIRIFASSGYPLRAGNYIVFCAW